MTDTLTHAITIPQPLAWAVAAGQCPVIMSDTRPDLAREGELIGIHAGGGTAGWNERMAVLRANGVEPPEHYPLGALIGVAKLIGVVKMARDLFVTRSGTDVTAQRHGFMRLQGRSSVAAIRVADDLADRIRPWWRSGTKWGLYLAPDSAVLLPEPIPMRGAGGVWRLPQRALVDLGIGFSRATPGEWALEQWRKARGA